MRRSIKIVLPLVILSTLVLTVFASWYLNRPVTMHGIIVSNNNFQIYQDQTCTLALTDLDWGNNLKHGDTVTKTFYMKNIGDTILGCYWNVTNGNDLSFTATNNGEPWPKDTKLNGWNSNGILTVIVTMTVGGSMTIGAFTATLNIYSTAAT